MICCTSLQILIHTMHKYVLEIIVSPMNGSPSSVTTLQETSFIAVSCYQNPKLTQLKIQYNQYAKGFRAPIPSRSPKVYAYGHGLLPSFSSLIPSAASPCEYNFVKKFYITLIHFNNFYSFQASETASHLNRR